MIWFCMKSLFDTNSHCDDLSLAFIDEFILFSGDNLSRFFREQLVFFAWPAMFLHRNELR
jgi:hypothetical protein